MIACFVFGERLKIQDCWELQDRIIIDDLPKYYMDNLLNYMDNSCHMELALIPVTKERDARASNSIEIVTAYTTPGLHRFS